MFSFQFNLDPFNEFKDSDMWTALEAVELQNFVKYAPSHAFNTSLFLAGIICFLCVAGSLGLVRPAKSLMRLCQKAGPISALANGSSCVWPVR